MKKQFSLLVIAMIALHFTAFPQAFVKSYVPVSNNTNLSFSCIAKVPGISHYYISGLQSTRLFIQEVDINGSIIQQKMLEENTSFYNIASMIVDADGNILLVGSNALAVPPYNGWMIKLSPTFTQLFHTNYFNSNTNNWLALLNVKDYKAGGVYYLSGQSSSLTSAEDALLLKVDRATGAVISSSFNGAPTTVGTSDTYYALYVDQNGVVASARLSTGSVGTFRPYLSRHSLSTLAVKKSYRYISNPATVSARLYGDDLILDGTNFIFTGSGDHSSTGLSNRVYLMSADSSTFKANWEYEYKLTPNNSSAPYPYFDQVLSESSGYIMSGHWYDGSANKELFLMKTDKNGSVQWCEQFIKVYTDNYNHLTTEVIDQGYVFSVGYELIGGKQHGILVKVPVSTGAVDSSCLKTLTVTSKLKTYSKKETVVANGTTYTVSSQSDLPSSLSYTDNVKCGSTCVNDTIDLGDHVLCKNGGSYTVCNQTFTTPGYYNVICKGADSCQHTYHFNLYNSTLTANAGPDATIPGCCTITLNGSASGGTPGYSYAWLPTTGLTNFNTANPTCSQTGTYTLTVTDANGCTSTDAVVIKPDLNTCCRLGEEDHGISKAQVFPNPSATSFTFKAADAVARLMIYNMVGQLVETEDYVTGDIQFGGELPNGSYIMKVVYANGKSEKLHVEKIAAK